LEEENFLKIYDEKCNRQSFGYGFGWMRHGVLNRFQDEIAGLLDISDTENIPIECRTEELNAVDA